MRPSLSCPTMARIPQGPVNPQAARTSWKTLMGDVYNGHDRRIAAVNR
jgi:hypothetical protein